MSASPCGVGQFGTQNSYKLKMTGIKNVYAGRGYYLNWKMRVAQCNNNGVLLKNCSISLDRYNSEGYNEDMDWEFSGINVELPIIAEVSMKANSEKDRIVQEIKSTPPAYIIGDSLLTSGQKTTLKIVGGILGTNAKWVWFDSCGGSPIDEGSMITVMPTKEKSIYYVRAMSPFDSTPCVSKTLKIDNRSNLSNAKIVSSSNDEICTDKPVKITLTAQNGRKGLKADWVWYKDAACGVGQEIGRGDILTDNITKTTIYYARIEGIEGKTECIQKKIIVNGYSYKPQEIIGLNNSCEGDSVVLRVTGGKLAANDPNARWVWSTSKDFNTPLMYGESIKIIAASGNSIFYVRGEGICNKTDPVFISLSVWKPSKAPNSIIYERQYSNDGRKKWKSSDTYTLKISGGILGHESNWYWLKKSEYKTDTLKITKEPLFTNFTANRGKNIVYVMARGYCNETSPVGITIDNKKMNTPNTNFAFINFGIVNQNTSNLILTAGIKNVYIRYKSSSIANTKYGNVISSYECSNDGLLNFPIDNVRYYEFTGNQIINRNSITGGFLFGFTKQENRNKDVGHKPIVRMYIGGGHGIIEPLWETKIIQYSTGQADVKWALNTESQIKGIEAEMGLFIRFGYFNIMGGMNVILGEASKKYINSTIGLGISLY
jgi:hypothetical protein